ncbi:hypothetical protein [Phycicoccus flavus]|uniref:TrbL/VirB6 plasmid conjugal transfer protein n=1 Tax=Phycicoccus flavus TaxID=2502783 RepID=A0A8T6R2L0_9MICO|nr:hypothetical protein [Phycicoccus flavus]NHA68217.1 hypothetical protein [Phycicoccus flavus]
MVVTEGWDDVVNPFTALGNAAGKVVADAWTVAMLGIWNAGLWLLRLVLGLLDEFLTPDLSDTGPLASTYRLTAWVALTLVVVLIAVQAGTAALRRDGRSVARMLLGSGQFVMVWACWTAYVIALLAACSGLTKAVMRATLGVDLWTAWQPWGEVTVEDVTDGTLATVLGVLGVLVMLAAVGHLVVLLARGAALVVLTVTAPVAAAGLVADVGQSWFWKSVRWTHAAALTPPLMALVLGAGAQLSTSVVTGESRSLAAAVGSAVPGVMLLLVSTFAPLALFKLLAFVDPGTSSGAAMRAGMASAGGLGGLLPGTAGAAFGGAGLMASSSDDVGRAAGEAGGEAATTTRFTQSASGFLGTVGGALGSAAGSALGAAAGLGGSLAAVGADATNQMGVGHNTYIPDTPPAARAGSGTRSAQAFPDARGELPDPAASPAPSAGGPLGAPAGSGAGAAATGGVAAGEAGAAAAAVPIVPV